LAFAILPLAIFVASTRRAKSGHARTKRKPSLPHPTPIVLYELNVHDATSIIPQQNLTALMALCALMALNALNAPMTFVTGDFLDCAGTAERRRRFGIARNAGAPAARCSRRFNIRNATRIRFFDRN